MSRSLKTTSPLRPRKTPRQPRSSETVASILEAAAQVLETKGLEGFNTNAVAQRAGVSIGSLYQYFPGKDALTIALMRRETERFRADAVKALNQPSGIAAMDYLIAATVRQQLRRPILARLLDVEESRPAFRAEVTGMKRFRAMIVEIIRRDDMPKLARPEVAAGDLAAMMRGMVDAAGECEEGDVQDLERRVRAGVFGYLSEAANIDGKLPVMRRNVSRRRRSAKI
ncbi:MAG: TetR/AcrR family transcriptional regulator [Proteobacteria bacterium]|nr:TetR/AcrR family transcriptional regulator [Pseudomonadota bacterium]